MRKLFIQGVCVAMLLFCFDAGYVYGQLPPSIPGGGTITQNADGSPIWTAPQQGPTATTKPKEPAFWEVGENLSRALKTIVLEASITVTQAITSFVAMVAQIFDILIIALTPTSDDLDPNSEIKFKIEVKTLVSAPWKIIRDVASIVLIFSLLYLGIKTILDGQGFADKKTLAAIIVAAILLNFSLIITKDVAFYVSNYIGQEVLKSAIPESSANASKDKKTTSFTEAMLLRIGPQKLLDKGINSQQDQVVASGWGAVWGYIFQTVVLTLVVVISAGIFIVLIIQLLVRFLIFIVLMITSPLGIIARTIPWLSGLGKTWWDELRKQTIYFPAFVFTMYIVFLIISTIGGAENSVELAKSSYGFFDGLALFFMNFLLIIGFLMILIIVPGKLSASGSNLANKAGDWTRKKIISATGRTAGAATFGTAALVGRNTVGRGASFMLKSNTLQTNAQNAKGFKGSAARALLKSADKTQNFSFDARSTKAGGNFAKKYNLGEASKGWKGTVEDKKKAYKEKMDKEKKLYGFDQVGKTEEHKIKVNDAKIVRDSKAKEVEEETKKLVEARKNGLSDSSINDIQKNIVEKQKGLEKSETEVGKLMQAGDSSYVQYLKRKRHSGLNVYKRMSRTEKAALEAMENDMKKEWQNAGKAKPVKQKKPASPRVTTTGAGTPPSTSTSSGSPAS